jgi:hypothetical protein
VTLLEVLFAITVASVGLLGAIAVFPLALAQARKGRLADTTSAGAQAAVAKFHAESMRRPDHWLYYFDDFNNNVHGTAFFPAAGGVTGSSPVATAFCIDPRFFEQNRIANANDGSLWSYFPAVPDGNSFNSGTNPNNATYWGRMPRLTLHSNNPDDDGDGTPNPPQNAASRMTFVQADQIFRLEDELLYKRPPYKMGNDDWARYPDGTTKGNEAPAEQLFTQVQTAAGPPPTFIAGRRQEEGRLTWMATLSPRAVEPQHVDHDNNSNTAPVPVGSFLSDKQTNIFFADTYQLSTVVFYNRSPDLVLSLPGSPRPLTEWTAKILGGTQANPAGGFWASGIGGGEVTITTNNPNEHAAYNTAEALELKRGDWIALSRRMPVYDRVNNVYRELQHLQWYRISDTEETARQVNINGDNRYERDVTLIGPDWPVDLWHTANNTWGSDTFADEIDVIIVTGAVHVYERSIKLDTGAAE